HTRFSRDWSSDVCSSDLGWNIDTERWLHRINDKTAKKLARVGLIAPRVAYTLGQLIDQHIEGKRKGIKPRSIKKLEQTRAKLLEIGRASCRERVSIWGVD